MPICFTILFSYLFFNNRSLHLLACVILVDVFILAQKSLAPFSRHTIRQYAIQIYADVQSMLYSLSPIEISRIFFYLNGI